MSNLLSSINFLFLTSLAITSWIILCYFKQIEEQKIEAINIDFTMERSFNEKLLGDGTGSGHAACGHNYDIYLNFVGIFACIYALAKITHLTESYIAKHFSGGNIQAHEYEGEPRNINEYRLKMQKLLVQLAFLEKKNAILERKLLQRKPTGTATKLDVNTGLNGLHEMEEEFNKLSEAVQTGTQTLRDPSPESDKGNVYITNRHFHMNQRQVFVNEGNVKLDLPNLNKNGGDFSQIWQKYFKMQNDSLDKSQNTVYISNLENDLEFSNPIVMTSVDYSNIQDKNLIKPVVY